MKYYFASISVFCPAIRSPRYSFGNVIQMKSNMTFEGKNIKKELKAYIVNKISVFRSQRKCMRRDDLQ